MEIRLELGGRGGGGVVSHWYFVNRWERAKFSVEGLLLVVDMPSLKNMIVELAQVKHCSI